MGAEVEFLRLVKWDFVFVKIGRLVIVLMDRCFVLMEVTEIGLVES